MCKRLFTEQRIVRILTLVKAGQKVTGIYDEQRMGNDPARTDVSELSSPWESSPNPSIIPHPAPPPFGAGSEGRGLQSDLAKCYSYSYL